MTIRMQMKRMIRKEVIDMWSWLKENHHVAYEIAQWSVLGIAVAALLNEYI